MSTAFSRCCLSFVFVLVMLSAESLVEKAGCSAPVKCLAGLIVTETTQKASSAQFCSRPINTFLTVQLC